MSIGARIRRGPVSSVPCGSRLKLVIWWHNFCILLVDTNDHNPDSCVCVDSVACTLSYPLYSLTMRLLVACLFAVLPLAMGDAIGEWRERGECVWSVEPCEM
jgi:hypothetical protein